MKRSLIIILLMIIVTAFSAVAAPLSPHFAVPAAGALAAAEVKVIGRTQSGNQTADLRLITDYGSYALYAMPAAEWNALSAAEQAALMPQQQMNQMWLAGGTVDGSTDTTLRARVSVNPTIYLVQFVGPIQSVWLDELAATGVTVMNYVANNGYMVWADGDSFAQLQQWAAGSGVVQYVGAYDAPLKVSPITTTARTLAGDGETAVVDVVVQMWRHPGQADTERFIASKSLAVLSDWEPVLGYQNATLTVLETAVAEIAARSDVVWVGPKPEMVLNDEVQTQILAGQWRADPNGGLAPGYLDWLEAKGFSSNPLDYPIVDITDDGVGDGLTWSQAATPASVLDSLNTQNRLSYVENCTNQADGGSIGGHGHLNLSIAGGSDVAYGFPYEDALGFQRGLGVNPYGRFAGTRIFSPSFDISHCGNSETNLIKTIADKGASISSNSWSCPFCTDIYDAAAQAYDAGTRDADPTVAGNQEMFFIFAAGNKGPTAATVGTPSSAKNVLTVGASENLRPDWTDGCGIPASEANNPMDIASFSSRGPVVGSRVKPELVAPGTHVQGAASPHVDYTGGLICDNYFPAGQTTFAASSGTSHAAPAVAGAASLVHFWLGSRYNLAAPSPAMLKAYLLAHTTYLTGVDAGDSLPGSAQGYGMPNLDLAFNDDARFLVDQTVLLQDSGEVWQQQINVIDPTQPVRVALVYTDAPGAVGTAPQVNDLNLAVKTTDARYTGNWFDGSWSMPGGLADSANNYETIVLPPGTADSFVLSVTAFNIAGDGVPGLGDSTDQDFALVCTNCAAAPSFQMTATPYQQTACQMEVVAVSVSLQSLLGFADVVDLRLEGLPLGSSIVGLPNTAVPPTTISFQISGLPLGTQSLQLVATAGEVQRQVPLTIFVEDAAPDIPTALRSEVAWNATETAVTLSWSPVALAEQYTVQVATDAAFTEIVREVSGVSKTTVELADLPVETVLYWRVRGTGACDGSEFSAVAEMTLPQLQHLFLPIVMH